MAPADGRDDGVANHNVVFLNTSLDTHLAMVVSDSDTVSDFKRSIMLEHRQLFPGIGDIKIECLKVKRRGSFYHLSDSMLVKSAFGAVKGSWFVSVDASRLEQNDGTQQLGKHKAGDQLALLWVTHRRSIERNDNHGSPSVHSKTAPLMNQKALTFDQPTSGDSCKDVSKNVEEDRLCNDKQLNCELQEKLDTVNTDINLKKRTRDVHNEGSLNDACGSGPSVKKKRKTQRGKSDVKAPEENLALTHDSDKVNDKGAIVNNENSFDHKSKGKDLSDENNRINKDENSSALDELVNVALGTEGVGSETVGDVAMAMENDVHQETSIGLSQKEKNSELVQKPAMENEIHFSLTRTLDCEHDAAGVTVAGHMERSTKHKTAEKNVSSTSFIKKLHNTNKYATESSPQQDVGSDGQECAGDQIDKYKDDSEISLKQRPELKLPERKKGAMGCENVGEGKRRKIKKRFKHADNLVGDISSTVLASVTGERKMNEVSEKTLVDAKKGDDVFVKEVDISVENIEEKSRNEFTDANDAVTATNEENGLPCSENPINNDADISTTGKNTSQVNAQGILDNLEKQNEKMDDTTKKKKKTKTKKSAGRNEDESITKHVNLDICENVKADESGLPDSDRKDGDMSSTVLDERKMNEDSEKTLLDAKKGDDVIVKEVEISVENMEENSRKNLTDANDVVTVTNEENILLHSESLMHNDTGISTTGKNTSQVNAQGMLVNLEKQNEKTDDTTKNKKKKKTKKSVGRNEDESLTKNVDNNIYENVKEGDRKDGDKVKEKEAQISNDGLAGKGNKNNKYQDLQAELESKKSQEIDHHHFPEKTSKNVPASEFSKVNNDVDIPAKASCELDFKDDFAPGHQQKKIVSIDNRKDMKKRKVGSRNDQSQKLVSEIENNKVSVDVLKDPNVTNTDELKPPKRTKKIDAQKTNRQQSTLVQTRVKTVGNKKVNSSQQVKSLLNAPGTIFGDGSDSDSRSHTPSAKASSSSSSSGESSYRRKVGSRNDQSQKLVSKVEKNIVSADVLKDPNITNTDKFKAPKRTKKIDAQKTNRQQSTLVQTRVKTVGNKKVNGSQQVKNLLNVSGMIFGDDNGSDSSTRTPSAKASSSSSSSGESSYSLCARRNRFRAKKENEVFGKDNANSQGKLKKPSISDLLRSSSSFKKSKVTVSSQMEDTESQPVDFVPESQP